MDSSEHHTRNKFVKNIYSILKLSLADVLYDLKKENKQKSKISAAYTSNIYTYYNFSHHKISFKWQKKKNKESQQVWIIINFCYS